jgi:hypothetical protein
LKASRSISIGKSAKKLSIAVLLLLGISWWAVPVRASEEFQPVSSDELKMTSEPLAAGAPAIILQRRVDRDDNAGFGVARENNYLRIKILTEEGRKYGNVEIPFYAGVGIVYNIKARTIGPDGSIAAFDGQVYEKYVASRSGLNVLVKTFAFPNVQVGSILEYFFTVDLLGNLVDSHWILNSELFTKRAQFSLSPFKGNYTPESMRWTWKEIPSGTEPKEGADHVIRMEVSNIPAFQVEDFMPPENELKARVDFMYQDKFGERDPDKYWKNIGKGWNHGLESFLRKHKAAAQGARQTVLPNDPPEEKLRKIYARVQQFRNTSYEPEKTAEEEERRKEQRAESVDDVWQHGYGNAVELTWLFLGMARAAGFEAHGCWVASRSEYFFSPKLMDSAGLRDNVVLVQLNGKDIYLDPGTAFTPFLLLPWNETATPGIRLDNHGGAWIRTPLPDSAESQIQRKARFKLSEAGDLEGNLTVTYTGLEAMYQRLRVRNSDEVGRKEYLEELVKEQVPAAAEVELTNKPDWSSSETPLQAEFAVKVPNWTSNTGRRVLVPVGIFAAAEKHVFESVDRVHPIYFAYPYSKRDDVTIELPPEWQAMTAPQARTQKGNSIVYSMNVEDNQKTLHVTRQLDSDIFILEQSNYSALRRFFQLVRSGDEEQIVLQPHGPPHQLK